MIDIINGNNTFRPQFQTVENVKGYVTKKSNSCYEIEFRAEHYLEPISKYAILFDNNLNELSIKCLSDYSRSIGCQKDLKLNNGEVHSAFFESVSRGTAPGFPYRVELTSKNGEDIKLYGLMRATRENEYKIIPCIFNN